MDIGDLALIVVGIGLISLIYKRFSGPMQSTALNKKFIKLGNMTGKSLNEISSIAGNPSTSESLTDGMAYTWSATKYAIKLKFDKNNICTGKLGEVSKK